MKVLRSKRRILGSAENSARQVANIQRTPFRSPSHFRAIDGPASGSSMARFAFLTLRMSSSEPWIEPSATRSPGSRKISSQYNTAWFSTGYLDHDSSVSTDFDHPPVSMKKRDPPELFRPPQGPNAEEPLPAHARWLTRSKVGADQ